MNRILELRNKLRMTQEEFADHCGIARSSIARYEASGNVSRANAEKIARACGVSVSYVIADTNGAPPAPSADDIQPEQGAAGQPWDVQYPAGVALRTAPMYQPSTSLSERDITRIAEKVAQINQDAKTTPVLNQPEQQLIEDFRLLSPTQRNRVLKIIGAMLDAKFLEPEN